MLSELVKGILPRSWRRYTIPVGTTVIQWITDFSLRVKQLQQVSSQVAQGGARELQSMTVWLGGLFNPEAYVTATRQCIAQVCRIAIHRFNKVHYVTIFTLFMQANSWSLEELMLVVTIEDQHSTPRAEDRTFGLTGLKLQGAVSQGNKLSLSSTMMTDLALTCLRWSRAPPQQQQQPQQQQAGQVTLPVYLNANRTDILFTVDLHVARPEEEMSFYERGVALLASTSLN